MHKVLIVDDEKDMCKGLSDVLGEEGFETFIAHEGKTALETVEKEKPDLVLLDLRLPGMDGIQILKMIKKINKNLPVIMITGYGNVDSVVQATELGVLDYITKPFENEKIVSLVRKTLQTSISGSPRGIMRQELLDKLKIEPAQEKVTEPIVIEKPAYVRKNKQQAPIRVTVLHILITSVLAGFVVMNISKLKEDAVYTAPYKNPSEIVWDGKNLWSSDWYEKKIFKHNLDASLSVAKTYQFNNIHPIALCWKGNYVWSCDAWTKKIYVHRLNEKLQMIASYISPCTNPSGLAWDGKNLWSCDADSHKIYKHILDDKLTVIAVYDSPYTNPSGLTWDGKNLWSCDTDSGKIYKHNMDSTLSVATQYSPNFYSSEANKLTGITSDGKYIWTVNESNNKIYKHNLFRIPGTQYLID